MWIEMKPPRRIVSAEAVEQRARIAVCATVGGVVALRARRARPTWIGLIAAAGGDL